MCRRGWLRLGACIQGGVGLHTAGYVVTIAGRPMVPPGAAVVPAGRPDGLGRLQVGRLYDLGGEVRVRTKG